MRILYIGMLLTLVFNLHGQVNLVPNPSFEDYIDCPYGFDGFFDSETIFTIVDKWMKPTSGTSDLFNSCASDGSGMSVPDNFFGYQNARTGSGYCGFYTYLAGFTYREYVQTKLTDTLNAGQCYYIEFYVSPAEDAEAGGTGFGYNYGIDEIGMNISDERYTSFITESIGGDLTPQFEMKEGMYLTDTVEWTKVCGFYEATGGEQWIIIGNFRGDDETDVVYIDSSFIGGGTTFCAYTFLDDVRISPVDSIDFLTDTAVCDPYFLLEAPECADGYLWNTGDTSQSITVTDAGMYWVDISTVCGVISDTASITFITVEETYTSENIEVCFSSYPYELHAPGGYSIWLWNTGETTESIFIDGPGIYVVSSSVDCGTLIDTIFVTSIEPELNIGNDTLICDVQPWEIEITADDDFLSYVWSTGETTQSIIISEPGTYSVDANSPCGIISDEIVFTGNPFEGITINLGNDTTLCFNYSPIEITYTAPDGLSNYLWNTGSTDQYITVSEAGTYWVMSDNPLCDDLSDSVNVFNCDDVFLPNAFSPNGDGINDVLYLIGLLPEDLIAFTIYNRWGEIVFQTNSISITWDGTYNNAILPMSVYAYTIQYKKGGSTEIKSGNITLVR